MDIGIFLAKLGRRVCWNLKSRHRSVENYQMFQRICHGEDVFAAPKFEPIEGVALKSMLILGKFSPMSPELFRTYPHREENQENYTSITTFEIDIMKKSSTIN